MVGEGFYFRTAWNGRPIRRHQRYFLIIVQDCNLHPDFLGVKGDNPLSLDNNGGIPVLSSTDSPEREVTLANLSRLKSSGVCDCTALRMASRRVSQMYDVALAP